MGKVSIVTIFDNGEIEKKFAFDDSRWEIDEDLENIIGAEYNSNSIITFYDKSLTQTDYDGQVSIEGVNTYSFNIETVDYV